MDISKYKSIFALYLKLTDKHISVMKKFLNDSFSILKKNLNETKKDFSALMELEKPSFSFPKMKTPFSKMFENTRNQIVSMFNELQEEMKQIKDDTGIFEKENGIDFIFKTINPKNSTLKVTKTSENEIVVEVIDSTNENVFERKSFSKDEPFEIKSYSTETTTDKIIVHVLFI